MPKRGTILSQFEQGQISALLSQNKSVATIAKHLKRSHNCIKKFTLRNGPYILAGGPQPKLNAKSKRRIVREMVNDDSISARRIISSLNLDVSVTTVYKFLHQEGYKYTSFMKAPFLNDTHKEKRFEWASKILIQLSLKQLDLEKITFSDEKRFLLDGPDGMRHYWHKEGTLKKYYGKKVFCKGIMVWAGFGYHGTTKLFIAEKSINSEEYQKIITECYIPYHEEHFLLMQDNAKPHVSASTHAFMVEKGIDLLQWPACSPDCNPMENLWAIMVQRIYAGNKCFKTLDQLKAAIIHAWDTISIEEVRKLVFSFPKRLVAVVASKGGEISEY